MHLHLKVLALTDLKHLLLHLASNHGIALEVIPVIEDALREGLSARCLTKRGHEAEGLRDWQVGLGLDNGGALTRILLEHAATAQVHDVVDTRHSWLRAGDLDQEHRLLQGRLASQLTSKAGTSRRRHDLTSATVNSIGVEGHILDVEADTPHVLLAKRTLLRGPL